MDPQTPRPHRRRRTVIALSASVLGVAALLTPNWVRLRALERRERAVHDDITHLTTRIAALTAEREKLASDPTYIERVARQEFRSTREGETLFRIEDAADGAADAATPTAPAPIPQH